MKLLYFAWVRQKVGCGEETVEPPQGARTVGDIAAWLGSRGPEYFEAFADMTRLRAAVNKEHVDFGAKVNADDEVAFFPPVTGG